jgi:hypothetical protein
MISCSSPQENQLYPVSSASIYKNSLLKTVVRERVSQYHRTHSHRSKEVRNTLLGTASIALALGASIVSLVVHGALGVGAEVLEGVFGGVLGLLGAAGDALVVGVGGGAAGLGAGLALGLGGLTALVGSRHCDVRFGVL